VCMGILSRTAVHREDGYSETQRVIEMVGDAVTAEHLRRGTLCESGKETTRRLDDYASFIRSKSIMIKFCSETRSDYSCPFSVKKSRWTEPKLRPHKIQSRNAPRDLLRDFP